MRSKRAGERVKGAITRFVTAELKLKVNEAKSAVDRPGKRKLLGYSFYSGSKLRVTKASIDRCKQRVRELTRRNRSISLAERLSQLSRFLRGWINYFALAETPRVLQNLDKWIRRRVRLCIWKTWKRVRTRIRMLRNFGLPEDLVWMTANCRRGHWYIAGSPALGRALSQPWLREQGLFSVSDRWLQLAPLR